MRNGQHDNCRNSLGGLNAAAAEVRVQRTFGKQLQCSH